MMMNVDAMRRGYGFRERGTCKTGDPGQELSSQHIGSLSHAILHLQ